MHSVGKFLTHFRRLGSQGSQVGGDESYGHQLMDRMVEEGFYLQRINNGSPAKAIRYIHEHFLRVVVDRRSTHRTSSRHCSELREAGISIEQQKETVRQQGPRTTRIQS
jgi:hypothetical protein